MDDISAHFLENVLLTMPFHSARQMAERLDGRIALEAERRLLIFPWRMIQIFCQNSAIRAIQKCADSDELKVMPASAFDDLTNLRFDAVAMFDKSFVVNRTQSSQSYTYQQIPDQIDQLFRRERDAGVGFIRKVPGDRLAQILQETVLSNCMLYVGVFSSLSEAFEVTMQTVTERVADLHAIEFSQSIFTTVSFRAILEQKVNRMTVDSFYGNEALLERMFRVPEKLQVTDIRTDSLYNVEDCLRTVLEVLERAIEIETRKKWDIVWRQHFRGGHGMLDHLQKEDYVQTAKNQYKKEDWKNVYYCGLSMGPARTTKVVFALR